MTRIAEIIEATTTRFVAGSYQMLDAPAFGALVRVEGRDGCAAYGLVYEISTGSREQGGRAVVRGRPGMYDEEIFAANPDLEAVLQTGSGAPRTPDLGGTANTQDVGRAIAAALIA